jgi:uncharacterized protein (DUF1697 family)
MEFADVEWKLRGREIYAQYTDGIGRSKLSNTVAEKKLGVAATNRNWNVTSKLAELAAAHARR